MCTSSGYTDGLLSVERMYRTEQSGHNVVILEELLHNIEDFIVYRPLIEREAALVAGDEIGKCMNANTIVLQGIIKALRRVSDGYLLHSEQPRPRAYYLLREKMAFPENLVRTTFPLPLSTITVPSLNVMEHLRVRFGRDILFYNPTHYEVRPITQSATVPSDAVPVCMLRNGQNLAYSRSLSAYFFITGSVSDATIQSSSKVTPCVYVVLKLEILLHLQLEDVFEAYKSLLAMDYPSPEINARVTTVTEEGVEIDITMLTYEEFTGIAIGQADEGINLAGIQMALAAGHDAARRAVVVRNRETPPIEPDRPVVNERIEEFDEHIEPVQSGAPPSKRAAATLKGMRLGRALDETVDDLSRLKSEESDLGDESSDTYTDYSVDDELEELIQRALAARDRARRDRPRHVSRRQNNSVSDITEATASTRLTELESESVDSFEYYSEDRRVTAPVPAERSIFQPTARSDGDPVHGSRGALSPHEPGRRLDRLEERFDRLEDRFNRLCTEISSKLDRLVSSRDS